MSQDSGDKKNPEGQARQFVERRKRKRDGFSQAVTVISLAGLIFALVTVILLDRASPVGESFFTRFLGTPVVSYWNAEYIKTAVIVMFLSFFLCAASFVMSLRRTRRKSDRYNKPIIVLGILSFVGLIVLLIAFRDFL